MTYRFDLAAPADDADLRRVLRENRMPGQIALTFEREPNYFLADETLGEECQVLVGREIESDKIVALACRATRKMWVNGQEETIGYLGQARLNGQPNPFVIARGFRFLKQLHDAAPVGGYITTIVDENVSAQQLLVERPLRGVPRYRFVDGVRTLAFPLRQSKRRPRPSACEIECGLRVQLSQIVAFLQRVGPQKQFFPLWNEVDFLGDRTRGFQIEDFLVARRGGEIVGVVGLWDQSAYKQTVVQSYSGALRWLRPVLNIAARLARMPVLPPPQQRLNFAYAACVCVADNDAQVFQDLLHYGCWAAADRGYDYLMLGLCERDELLPIARRMRHIAYRSRLYSVHWDDQFHDRLDDRVPYVEIAAL